MQLNHIKYESTDSESDTDNAISINMIHVENDHEPIIYEQLKHSHIYQNHDHFLLNFYTRPINSNTTIEKIVEEITEEKPIESSSRISINNIISTEKQNLDYFTKTPYFKTTFQISKNKEEQEQPLNSRPINPVNFGFT